MRQHKFDVIRVAIAPPLINGPMQCFRFIAQAVDEDDGCLVLSQRLDNVRIRPDRNGRYLFHHFVRVLMLALVVH